MDDFSSEIHGSSSCSNPSVPPDIRNWFSSYKYESFVLDTCDNFGGISSDENDSNKYESTIEKEENFDGSEEIRNVDEAENFNSKEDSLRSLLVLSEPSDIRKWYSSYVYESPLLDTNDGFNSYASGETKCEKHELVNEESIKDDFANLNQFQQDASDKICSTKMVKSNSSLVDRKDESHPLFSEPLDIGNWFPDYVYESPVLDTNDEFKDTLGKDTESSQNKSCVEDSMGRKQDDFKTKVKARRRDEAVTGNMCSSGLGECNRNSPLRHDKQENRSISKVAGKDIAENGFIATKKANDENSQRGRGEILLQCSRKARGGGMKRKVLTETTNINVEQAKAMEITGKWRCPQKTKPPRCPPLKQLRLERWVHRA